MSVTSFSVTSMHSYDSMLGDIVGDSVGANVIQISVTFSSDSMHSDVTISLVVIAVGARDGREVGCKDGSEEGCDEGDS
jgi:hypothetical protein